MGRGGGEGVGPVSTGVGQSTLYNMADLEKLKVGNMSLGWEIQGHPTLTSMKHCCGLHVLFCAK